MLENSYREMCSSPVFYILEPIMNFYAAFLSKGCWGGVLGASEAMFTSREAVMLFVLKGAVCSALPRAVALIVTTGCGRDVQEGGVVVFPIRVTDACVWNWLKSSSTNFIKSLLLIKNG